MMTFSGKTVLIDCNDSFTYNVQELLRKTGAEDLEIIKVSNLLPEAVEGARRIILSPGPGIPEEYPEIFGMLNKLNRDGNRIPVLGICLGHQILCTFFGGRLYNLDEVVHGQPHILRVLSDDYLFAGVPSEFTVGLYHSWAVCKPLPPLLEVTAESESGVIMGVRHRLFPYRWLQFHPESFISGYGKELF
jgi:para-aminobenzoate synthetase component 2